VVYNSSIDANGGSGSGYVFTVNGTPIPTTGTTGAVLISDGISVYSTGSNTLSISGTPSTTGTVTLSNVTVKDGAGDTAGPDTYTIAVNGPGSSVSGQITLNNFCGNGGSFTLPTFTVSINTPTPQQTNTDSNGNYAFASVPNGTYTITPSITGPSSLFYPATQAGVVVDNNPVSGENFGADLGYTVSGSLSYAGSKTGQVYVDLNNNSCGSGNGTSITDATLTSGGAYTVRGVGPGNYSLKAWMDITGQGTQNTSDPSGSDPSTLTVSTANVTGAAVTLTDPTVGVPSAGPSFQNISPTNLGVAISFNPITNSNGVEAVTSYTLEWSTSSTFTSPSSITLKAIGKNGNVWFVNNSTAGISGSFVNGTQYYFRACGNVTAGSGPFANWGGTTPTAVTIGSPSGTSYFTVQGTVTLPASIPPTGPLYVGMYDQNTGAVYATRIASPSNSSPNSYTVSVLGDSNPDYFLFAILDQNNDGLIDLGDVSNTNNNNSNGVAVPGNLTGQDVTLTAVSSTATATTQTSQFTNGGVTTTEYSLNLDVREGNKLPVAVTLASGPNLIHPIDMGSNCQNCGTPQWQYYANIGGNVPNVGDTYVFDVTYSDGTTGTVSGTVSGILGSSALVTLISPTGDDTSLTPSFDWTYPANPGNYTYQFSLCCGDNGNIWNIPSNNSNSNGFTNTQITPPLVWNQDPTNSGNTASPSILSSGSSYSWQVESQDSNGNSAVASANFETSSSGLTLPSNSIPGSALVNLPYTASLYATGGSGGDVFTVNGVLVPGSPFNLTLSNGLSVSSNGGTLTISGTPTSTGTVTLLNVMVTDSSSDSAGPETYSVIVSSQPSGTNNSSLSGTYVCELGGLLDSDSSEWASLFSFTANGSSGTFTNGIFDSNGNNNSYYPNAVSGTVTGTYSVGADFNGLATFNTSPSLLGTTTSQWAIALTHNASPAAEFRLVEIDDVGSSPSGHHATGDCYHATTSAFAASTVSGKSFAFGATGTSNGGGPKTIVGRWTDSAISGSSGTVTSGTIDQAKNIPTTYSNIAFTGGSYTLPASPSFATYGRYTLTFSSGANSVDYVVYVIDSGRMFLLGSTGVDGTQAGHVRTQQQASYSAANLNSNFVLYSEGLDNNGSALSGAYSWIAQVKGDGVGNLTFNESYNDQDGQFVTGYENGGPDPVAFDSANAGRATMAAGGSDTLYYYLYDNNAGFVMNVKINTGNSSYEVDSGWIDAQTQTNFTDANLAGNYMGGQFPPLSVDGNAFVGEIDVLNNGTADAAFTSAGEQNLEWDQAETSVPYSFTSTTYGTYTFDSGANQFDCIGISSTKTVCIESVEGSPAVAIFQQ